MKKAYNLWEKFWIWLLDIPNPEHSLTAKEQFAVGVKVFILFIIFWIIVYSFACQIANPPEI